MKSQGVSKVPAAAAVRFGTFSRSEIELSEEEIAKGATATVYKARIKPTGNLCAAKMYAGQDVGSSIRRDLATLEGLKDLGVARFTGVIEDSDNNVVGVLTELVQGNLEEHLRKHAELCFRDRLAFCQLVAHSIEFSHMNGIVHEDIKLENILMNDINIAKLCDFAPLDTRCDVFSFGMLMWVILHHPTPPFGKRLDAAQLKGKMSKGERPVIDPEKCPSEAVRKLIEGCWDSDPAQRPTMAESKYLLAAMLRRNESDPIPSCIPFFPIEPGYKPPEDLLPCIFALLPDSKREKCKRDLRNFMTEKGEGLRRKYGLDNNEILALVTYIMGFGDEDCESIYARMNKRMAQRSDQATLGPYLPLIVYMLRAFDKLPRKKIKRVYRGVKNCPLTERPQYLLDNKFFWVAFTSTSKTVEGCLLFLGGSAGTLVVIEDAEGYDLEDFKIYEFENEFLLMPNSHLKITTCLPATEARDALSRLCELADASPPRSADYIVAKYIPMKPEEHPLYYCSENIAAFLEREGCSRQAIIREEAELRHSMEIEREEEELFATLEEREDLSRRDIMREESEPLRSLRASEELSLSRCRLNLRKQADRKKSLTVYAAMAGATMVGIVAVLSMMLASTSYPDGSLQYSVAVDIGSPSIDLSLLEGKRVFVTNAQGLEKIPDKFLRGSRIAAIQFSDDLSAVRHIGEFFLAYCSSLESIDLRPLSNVQSVGDGFLGKCSSLKSIDFTPLFNVQSVGLAFLAGCSSLKRIDLTPLSNLQSIGDGFFDSCSSLKSIDLTPLSNVRRVGNYFLANCSSLESINLTPLSNVQSVGKWFLYGCSSLKSIDLTPLSNVQSVGNLFLCDCSSLKSIDLTPLSKVQSVGDHFLEGSSSLKSIDLKPLSNVQRVGKYFLDGCKFLKTIDLKGLSNVQSVGDHFLKGSSSLESIDLKPLSNVQSVGNYFLDGCSSLKSIDLKPLSNVQRVGDHFLQGCKFLKSIDLKGLSNVQSVGDHFLEGSSSLKSIDLKPLSNVQSVGHSFLAGCSLESIDLTPLSNVQSVGNYFLSVCKSLKSIDLKPLSNVQSVGDWFLYGCKSLKSIDLKPLSNVQSVGDYILSGCTSLRSIVVGASLKDRLIDRVSMSLRPYVR